MTPDDWLPVDRWPDNFSRLEASLKPTYGLSAPYRNPQTLESIRRSHALMDAFEKRMRLDVALVSMFCAQPHRMPA